MDYYINNGSMTRNPDRHIGLIEYDRFNNPRLIQFTDGSVTEYVYDASGTKLKTLHRTAVPGIDVPYGTVYEHTSSTVLGSDSTLYDGPFVLSGDSLRYKYDGGSVLIPLDGSSVKPTFYALDHLDSVRLVVSADGQVMERSDYYPSGCMITGNITNEGNIQPYKYNGKELDPMHGLYTYDYGARQYDPATMLWDRMDPLCEKYYNVSPYVYCNNNPINAIDPDGRDTYLYARQLNAYLPMSLGVHTFIVVNILGKEPQYFSYGPSGKYLGTLTRTYYKDDIDIYTHADKTLQYEAIRITPPEGMSEIEFDNNVIKAANSFYEDSNVRYDILSPSESLDTGNCNSSTSTLLNKAGISKEKIDEIKENIPGNSYGFGDIKPWTKEEKDKLEKK